MKVNNCSLNSCAPLELVGNSALPVFFTHTCEGMALPGPYTCCGAHGAVWGTLVVTWFGRAQFLSNEAENVSPASSLTITVSTRNDHLQSALISMTPRLPRSLSAYFAMLAPVSRPLHMGSLRQRRGNMPPHPPPCTGEMLESVCLESDPGLPLLTRRHTALSPW